MNKALVFFLTALLLCFQILCVQNAKALTIDNFSDDLIAISSGIDATDTQGIATSNAIGGARKLSATKKTGGGGSRVIIETYQGILAHSQDNGVTALSSTTWDGTSAPGLNPAGLGGIDLLQDGGSSFLIDLLSFDFPNSSPAVLTIRVYDSNDDTGGSHSTATFTLNGQISSPTTIEIPFSQFQASGINGGADFTRVGAITLGISGPNGNAAPSAMDLSIDSIRTNGQCEQIPGIAGQVIDQCGVCGGNGTSCLDCNGTPFGGLTFDRCEVCGGDGQSCLECNSKDITELLASMDGGAKVFEKTIRKLLNRIAKFKKDSKTKTYISKTRTKTHELQVRNWILSWTIPRISTQCANTSFCISSSNSVFVEEYRTHENELFAIANDALKRLKRASRSAKKDVLRFTKAVNRVHDENISRLSLVPESQSVCI